MPGALGGVHQLAASPSASCRRASDMSAVAMHSDLALHMWAVPPMTHDAIYSSFLVCLVSRDSDYGNMQTSTTETLVAQATDGLPNMQASTTQTLVAQAADALPIARRLRERPIAMPPPPATLETAPDAPNRRLLTSAGGVPIVELIWDPVVDDRDSTAFLATHLCGEFLDVTTMPVILTCVSVGGAWEPWVISAEDFKLAEAGFPGQLGLFAARAFQRNEVVERYDGELIGTFVADSEAYVRAVRRRLASVESSYLFEINGARKGTCQLWDGTSGRDGGPKRANSARGLGCPHRAIIDFEGDMVVTAPSGIPALTSNVSRTNMHRHAIFVDYGTTYWDPVNKKRKRDEE